MKKTIVTVSFILISIFAYSQDLHSKAYGNSTDKPIIFLHGGPGYNSVGFEVSTAQNLSEHGFYVIVYDRRGEGRSVDDNARFTFQETLEDLKSIYKKYNLEKAILIGHSFGGIVGTYFAEKNPKMVNSLILVGAPISMQETFKTIIDKSESIYVERGDDTNLKYMTMLKNMDPLSLEYSSYCFGHAMQNGFYYPKAPTEEALSIYNEMKTNSKFSKYGSQMTYNAPQGFFQNEKYTELDLNQNIQELIKNNTRIFGIYGTDDGLFSTEQTKKIKILVGQQNFKYLENCSHNVFIDQQGQFINLVKEWTQ